MRALLIAAAVAAFASPALAADIEVIVNGANGKPVQDAVVTVHLLSQPTPRARVIGPYVIDQRNIQFSPFVSVVPAGASVAFMNHDALRHHVYSFSPTKRFELKLESRAQDRSVLFDKPGIVPLGCNIHDRMIAYVDVVDTPWAAATDGSGRVVLRGFPAGSVSVEIWHPYLRAPTNRISRQVAVADGQAHRELFAVALRQPPRTPDVGY